MTILINYYKNKLELRLFIALKNEMFEFLHVLYTKVPKPVLSQFLFVYLSVGNALRCYFVLFLWENGSNNYDKTYFTFSYMRERRVGFLVLSYLV